MHFAGERPVIQAMLTLTDRLIAGPVLTGGFVVAGALAAAGSVAAQAQTHARAPRAAEKPVTGSATIRLSQATIDCTVYGSGYVVVQGTTRCVRIRGRMRLRNSRDGFRGANFLPYAGAPRTVMPGSVRPAATTQFWRR